MEKGCPSCGRMVSSESEKCPFCNYDFGQLNAMFKKYEDQRNPEIKVPKYAGFIKRTVANIIDNLLLTFIFLIINAIYLYFINPSLFTAEFLSNFNDLTLTEFFEAFIPIMIMPVVYFFYCVFRQSSKNMGTIGEKLLGIEIIDEDEGPLSFGLAFKRNLARILDILTLGIGYLIMIFTPKKQALSDLVTHTYATNRITSELYNTQFYAGWFKRSMAYIADIIILRLVILAYSYLNGYLMGLDVASNFEAVLTITKYAAFGVFVLIVALYFPYMESNKGATIGKMIFNLKVRDLYGEKISFIHAIGRFILFNLQLMLIPFALLLIFVTPRKQDLKDILSKTVVAV